MMGLVPFATPQTFSRIVVLPALALPMTRIRKYGHRYRSLSTLTCVPSESAPVRTQIMIIPGIILANYSIEVHWLYLPSLAQCFVVVGSKNFDAGLKGGDKIEKGVLNGRVFDLRVESVNGVSNSTKRQ